MLKRAWRNEIGLGRRRPGAAMIERDKVIASLGGADAVSAMDSEARAEGLEGYLSRDLDARIETRAHRRGVGSLFAVGARTPFGDRMPGEPATVGRLSPMPDSPTLLDFFERRFAPAAHVLQSADKALLAGLPEDIVLACLLHDVAQVLMRADHGWWGAQLFEPYVSPKVAFAIRYHQALRFYPDAAAGYEYPMLYNEIFGSDYEPPAYIEQAYRHCRAHRWYGAARLVTVNDLYSFDPNHAVDPAKFTDIIGRHFKQPRQGLGFDGSGVAHMWRTIAAPDTPL